MRSVLPGGLNGAFNLRLRRPIGAHRVQGYDAWHGSGMLAGFLDIENFATLVVAALRASAVRQLAFVTIRAFGERPARECIVGTPGAGALLGVPPFWIGHLDSSRIQLLAVSS